jgi:hypothetical protein
MAIGDVRRLGLVGFDRAGDEVGFRIRMVALEGDRWGAEAPGDLVVMVERDPRVRLEDGTTWTAAVLRSGRTYAEVHGRLRGSRRWPGRGTRGPVLVLRPGEPEPGQANSA